MALHLTHGTAHLRQARPTLDFRVCLQADIHDQQLKARLEKHECKRVQLTEEDTPIACFNSVYEPMDVAQLGER